MRAITLVIKQDKKLVSYDFFRIIGNDDENAKYGLVSKNEGGFIPIIEFEGTMESNARNLLKYFQSEKGFKIIRVTGDEELVNYIKDLIRQSFDSYKET